MYTFSWFRKNDLYQHEKVDTEKIFQLNNFSKVDSLKRITKSWSYRDKQN